jgi:hypothetical protein
MRCIIHTLLLAGVATSGAWAAAPVIGGCQVFPSDHIFNTRIDSLPVHPQSAAFITTINSGTRKLHLDLGVSEDMTSAEYWGIPYNVVAGKSITWQPIYLDQGYPDESDCAGADHAITRPCVNVTKPQLPIAASPKVEGGIETNPANDGDHHILTIDSDACVLWEAYHSYPHTGGGWDLLSSAAWDLKSNALRPADWTSSDAAGFPILPLLLRADEASSGTINHALRFTIESSKIRAEYTWPARHLTTNGGTSTSKPPMGQLFRLKADYPIPAGANAQSVAILTALKQYGMYVADGGSDMYIQGEPNAKWEDATFSIVQSVPHTAFEAVDLSPIMARPGFSADSAAVPPASGGNTGMSIQPTIAGSASSLTLSASITVASADKGKAGSLYVAALWPTNGQVYSLTANGWQAVPGLALQPYSSVTLGSHTVAITSQLNVSALKGLRIYAGYGTDLNDLITGSKYALLYTVPGS